MAIPLLAPLAPFLPVIKVVLLGSVKFVALGIGAGIIPVQTANFLVGMSSSTPLKHAEFRFKKGYLSEEEIERTRQVFKSVNDSITKREQFLTRAESREFLKSVMQETWRGMKQSVISLPSKLVSVAVATSKWLTKLLRSLKSKLS